MKNLITLGLSFIFTVNVFAFEGNDRNYVVGASLQNKADNSVLELHCLETNQQRDCIRMQYYLRMAEIADPIGPEFSARDFIMTPDEIDGEVDEVANHKAEKVRFNPFAVSDWLFEPGQSAKQGGDVPAELLYVLGGTVEITAIVFSSIYAPHLLVVCGFVFIFAGASTIDLIVLPFKTGYAGIHNAIENRKARRLNRREEKKLRMTYKKLFKMVGGNPGLVRIKEKHFNQIVDTIEAM